MTDSDPTLDKNELKRICFELASQTIMPERPLVDVEKIQELSSQYFSIAGDPDLEEFILKMGRDPNLVISIVKYLDSRYAYFQQGSDVTWFREMFSCLVDLACPNCGGREQDEQLFQEIEQGIAWCRADYQESD